METSRSYIVLLRVKKDHPGRDSDVSPRFVGTSIQLVAHLQYILASYRRDLARAAQLIVVRFEGLWDNMFAQGQGTITWLAGQGSFAYFRLGVTSSIRSSNHFDNYPLAVPIDRYRLLRVLRDHTGRIEI